MEFRLPPNRNFPNDWFEILHYDGSTYIHEKSSKINSTPFNPDYTPQTELERYMYTGRNWDKRWLWGEKMSLCLSSNPGITLDFIKAHPEKPWNFGSFGVSCNPNFTPEIILENIDDGRLSWGYTGLTRNPSITIDLIEKTSDKWWCWGEQGLSQHPAMTLEYVLEIDADADPRKRWEWGGYGLSRNPCITPEYAEETPYRDWEWGMSGFSRNPSVSPEYIEDHPEKSWCWGARGISANPSLTPEFIKRHFDKLDTLSPFGLAINPALTDSLLKELLVLYPHKRWDEMSLCKNPSITIEFLKKYILDKDSLWCLTTFERLLSQRWSYFKLEDPAKNTNPVLSWISSSS
jgi:hypothetical protein